jgi:tetratricopeptide (TPR) repeat protein
MNPELLPPEPSPQERMLQHAIEAIRQENFAQAREILTKLLKADQNNPAYWVWMSAAMETKKERLYCLQAAYKLDPTDVTARRGLILMGALPPDDSIQPFPMNHPRPWENKLKLADEKPKPTGLKRVTGNPVFRLAAIFGAAGLVIIGSVIGLGTLLANRPTPPPVVQVFTPRPTVTEYATSVSNKPTLPPLAAQLEATYTPTPVYGATPHVGAAQDIYKAAQNSLLKQQWDNSVNMWLQLATVEPGSVDALYFAGEARRLAKRYNEALTFYNEAIRVNPNYAPSYLGKARANLGQNPNRNVLPDLDKAIANDPYYFEAYLERALYHLKRANYAAALKDVEEADAVNPESPLIKITLARVLLAMGENQAALEAAIEANRLDITMLDGYVVLGMAYRANGQIEKAVETLEIYVQYQPDNAEAFTVLGAAYFNDGNEEAALKSLQQALRLDRTSSEAYYWLGELYLKKSAQDGLTDALREQNIKLAVENLEKAVQYNAESFRNAEGLARAYMANGKWGNAIITIGKVEKQAANDVERGQFLYINAKSHQNMNFPAVAIRDWNALLALPEEAVPPERRAEAQEQLEVLKTPTKVPPTPTETRTPPPTRTVTVTPTPRATRQPSATPTPTNTRQPSATP